MTQDLAHFKPRLVQLRLGITHRALQQTRNLAMFVAFDLVQQENCAVTIGKFFNGTGQRDAVDRGDQALIVESVFPLLAFHILSGRLIQGYLRPPPFPEIH